MTKRILLAVLAMMFFSQPAMADNKTKTRKWLYLAGLPVYYFGAQIPIHEGSHALAVGLNDNYAVTKFQPYPHFTADREHFFLGSVGIICRGAACEDKTGSGVISLAPYMADIVIFTTADLLLSTNAVEPTSITGRVLYCAGMAVPWWDFAYNSVWAVEISDANHISQSFEIPRSAVMTAGITVSAVGLWRLWNGYRRAFSAPSSGHANLPAGQAGESNLVIRPIGSSQMLGVSVRGSF